MTITDSDVQRIEDPESGLERAFIDEFFRVRGIGAHALSMLPAAEASRLLSEASTYAATKLAEIEARAHFVHELHPEEHRK